jgi:SAM-dependent methyltransferase
VQDERRFAPATQRNREPILEVLKKHVKPCAKVLEIASGSGEHAVFLAPRLDVGTWQPTDADPEARASIDAWREWEKDKRVLPAIELDVTKKPWPVSEADVVVCINMIHISPWKATVAMLDGAGRILPAGGILYLYGPYRRNGMSTSDSNEAFDQSLRARNEEWGVRDMEDVAEEALEHGLVLADTVAMPANNFSLVFKRAVPSEAAISAPPASAR